jgi:hypothetical protein
MIMLYDVCQSTEVHCSKQLTMEEAPLIILSPNPTHPIISVSLGFSTSDESLANLCDQSDVVKINRQRYKTLNTL